MAVSLYFGHLTLVPEVSGYLLDTDIGHPLLGPPGVIGLFQGPNLLYGKYLGYTSPKYCVQSYLEAVSSLMQEYRLLPSAPVLVRCHCWTSGIGKILLSDIVRLTQPVKITEYHSSESVIDSLSSVKTTFLQTNYPFPRHVILTKISIEGRNISDYKQRRNELMLKFIQESPANPLPAQAPWVGQIERFHVFLNGVPASSEVLYEAVGRICGLSTLLPDQTRKCLGVGLIRDVNLATGFLWVLTQTKDMDAVDALESATGDGALDVIWTPTEASNPFFVKSAIGTQTRQKFHPNRSYAK